MRPIAVTQLNTQIKALLESHFMMISVEGEISNFTSHSSGHLYFSLKDENSTVRCVMFKGNTTRLKFKPQNGMKIIATCGISVYTPRGEYQLLCESLEPSGIGSLKIAFEQLKQKLESKGYFESTIKKKLPRFPQKIALITSSTGAALQDMIRVAEKRWNFTKFVLFNTLVQGDGAKDQIVNNLHLADMIGADIIVLARGGGSIEDLWPFNEEDVANAIYQANTPIVSAIGHEIDYLISDFVADLRAPTPSAAIEMILPDKNEIALMLAELQESLLHRLATKIQKYESQLTHVADVLNSRSPSSQVELKIQELGMLTSSIKQAFISVTSKLTNELMSITQNLQFTLKSNVVAYESELRLLKNTLEHLNPDMKSSDMHPMVVKDNKPFSIKELKIGDNVELQTVDVTAVAEIKNVKKN